MSVVERAIDKLRRSPPGTTSTVEPTVPAAPIAALVTEQPAPAGQDSRRILIDRAALRAAGYLPDENQGRRFADEYRQIKRPVLGKAFAAEAASRQPDPRLVMMASALPGDGKTFTSINLAFSLSRERDTGVVLIDADVAKPHISGIFGVQEEMGLLDALNDPALDPNSLVLPTDVKGLSILPAGQVREGATELLSSERMGEVARQLLIARPRQVMLFDSSPLVVSTESRALAVTMGQIIMVVRAGKTPRHAVLQALEALADQERVSLVLNQGRRSLMDGYYGYAYGQYGSDANG
jgi:protein-tyrosine kinase